MKKLFLFFFIAVVVLISGINSRLDAAEEKIKVETINGIKNIYNPESPLKGEIKLELEKSLEIDPEGINGLEDMFFDNYERDQAGNVYLIDDSSVHIYKFDSRGKYLKTFLQEGEGPGEVKKFPLVQIESDFIRVIGRKKAAKFTCNGVFVNEFKFKDFYLPITFLHTGQFIANYECFDKDDKTGRRFKKYTGLFDLKSQKCLLNLFEADNAGKVFFLNGNYWMPVIPSPGILPDIIYAIDSIHKRLYISLNDKYEIHVKGFDGVTRMIIHKPHNNSEFKKNDKLDIIHAFGVAPGEMQKKIFDVFPDKLCAIKSINLLPGGFLLVKSIIRYKEYRLDIFGNDGTYLYRLNLDNIPTLSRVNFYKQTLAGIEETEDRNIYREFRIKSHPEIFN
jgi:hypothetical protein